jgi:hypothetical protein
MLTVVGVPFDKAFLILLASARDDIHLASYWVWVWVGCESRDLMARATRL